MQFEFDPNKSDANKLKHGICFVEAQKLWNDLDRFLILAKTQGEARFMLIGKIGQKHWSAIFTYRDESIRIISVRHSRVEEVNIYEN